MVLANYFLEFTDLEKIWFVISPQNPFKEKKTLLGEHHRLQLVNIAIEENSNMKASDIEFKLPQPSYTINTLTYLKEKHPSYKFVLIMGEDNLQSFHKWKNYEEILKHYEIYVYPRKEADEKKLLEHSKVKKYNAPLIEISSTFIRHSIKEKKDVGFYLPANVWKYIKEMHFYEK